MSSVVTPGSIGGFGSSAGLSTPKKSPTESTTPWPFSQSGRPATGTRGSPASSGSARQFETPGYGWDAGPGYQRSVIVTGNAWLNGTKRPGSSGVPAATSPHTASALSAI